MTRACAGFYNIIYERHLPLSERQMRTTRTRTHTHIIYYYFYVSHTHPFFGGTPVGQKTIYDRIYLHLVVVVVVVEHTHTRIHMHNVYIIMTCEK